ncbi:hypothetical protein J3D56_001157 [Erwinia persicina]|uniref:Uncharacterized protein n=2 Tax=Erwinia TaxID=551 RepID=A0ABV4E4T4_9GAMM|nr:MULTISPECIES: hypothetical protein [Erwinia]MCP1437721.1 hypothetical protein [Erwinia persicina]MDN4628407.1 hypothetical protein [Erwinia sp. PsM31]MDN8541084.1 hypothetical protein [Erwinia sp. BC051422]
MAIAIYFPTTLKTSATATGWPEMHHNCSSSAPPAGSPSGNALFWCGTLRKTETLLFHTVNIQLCYGYPARPWR